MAVKLTNNTGLEVKALAGGWVINGGNGVDVIDATNLFVGKTGNLWQITAGNGADIVNGSFRDEIIWGDSKDNTDTASNGADTLRGGGGKDQIHGGNGGDVLSGDQGADTLWGDRGGDTFKYNYQSSGEGDSDAVNHLWSGTTSDWIKDFNKVDGDKLDLSGFNGHLTGVNAPDMLQSSSGPSAYGVWLGSQGDTGTDKIVYADTNGDGLADVAIRVSGNVDAGSISGLNHAPTAGNDTFAIDEDVAGGGSVAFNDSDPDAGQTLSYALSDPLNAPAGLTFNADGSFGFDADSYDSLASGETRSFDVGYGVSDGHGGSDTAMLRITITGTNDTPTISVESGDSASATRVETDAGLTASGTLTLTDVDTSDTVNTTVTAATDGLDHFTQADLMGMFSLTGASGNEADGMAGSLGWSFDSGSEAFDFLAAGESLDLTFTLAADDGHGGQDAQTVTITITGSNDAAVISGADSGSVTEDAATNFVSGTLSISDADHDQDSFAVQNDAAAAYGRFSINTDGSWTYTLDNADPLVDALQTDSDPLVDQITVRSADGTEHVITITINGHDDAAPYDSPPVDTAGGDPNDFDQFGNPAGENLSRNGTNGGDIIYGGGGSDTINAGGGNDTIYGGSGDDNIDGNGELDTLFGGSGNDTIKGANDDDRIIGGYGGDNLDGGNGADKFIYLSARDTGDRIGDFTQAQGDKIDFTALHLSGDFGGLLSGAGALNGHDYGYAFSGDNTIVYADLDRNGTTDLEITLVGHVALTASDFLF